jgi:hypothetical protein
MVRAVDACQAFSEVKSQLFHGEHRVRETAALTALRRDPICGAEDPSIISEVTLVAPQRHLLNGALPQNSRNWL